MNQKIECQCKQCIGKKQANKNFHIFFKNSPIFGNQNQTNNEIKDKIAA